MSDRNRTGDFGTFFSTCASLIAPGHQQTGYPRYERQIEWPVRAHCEGLLRRFAKTVQLWLERSKGRGELIALDDRLLKDIGLSRAQAQAEWLKPFWRA